MSKKLTSKKAAQILHDGEVKGHALTKKQRGFMGVVASGKKPAKGKR